MVPARADRPTKTRDTRPASPYVPPDYDAVTVRRRIEHSCKQMRNGRPPMPFMSRSSLLPHTSQFMMSTLPISGCSVRRLAGGISLIKT